MRSVLKLLKRWLLLAHRWLGIGTGLFFAVWILSGLVMLYVGFPALTEAERLARQAPIAWDRVALGPDAIPGRAGGLDPSLAVSLAMRGDEPVYQLVAEDGGRRVISAVTGRERGPLTEVEIRAFAAAQADAGPSPAIRRVQRDQWTVRARYDPLRPFAVLSLDDPAGTELYLSEPTGALVLDTTRTERFWNWFGAIPHWLYWTPLRAREPLWRDVILWLSGVGIVGALSGLGLGLWRLRLRRPYASGAVTPYRGVSRLHHLFGLAGGLTLLTFVTSGWLSMNPSRMFSPPGPPLAMRVAYAGNAPLPDRDALRDLARLRPDLVEVRLVPVGGRTLLVGLDARGGRSVATGGAPLARADLVAAAQRILPEARLRGAALLTAYDAYWYPHHEARPLPVLRVRFDDPAATWLHLDPETGAILNRLDRSGRVGRWLYEGLHRLDVAFLFQNRPAWDAVMWGLNGLGAVIALTGTVLGWRRLRRRTRSVVS